MVAVRAELGSVRAELLEAMDRVEDGFLDWAPSEGMRTVRGQLVEILATEISTLDFVLGRDSGEPEVVDGRLFGLADVAAYREELERVRAESLEGLSRAELEAPVELSAGFREYLGLEVVPAGELFRFLARHESYHTGQLVSYLWTRGLNPYDWE